MMKGLLLTDIYMMKKYCRSYFFIVIVFIGAALLGNENSFFVLYPIVIASMLPVTLISYDERSKWNVYRDTMPVTRAQAVSAKYLLTLCITLAILLLIAATQGIRLSLTHTFVAREYWLMLASAFVMGMVGPSLLMPFIYRYGVEKGRIAYYFVLVLVCAFLALSSTLTQAVASYVNAPWVVLASCAVSTLLYVGSWRLSVAVYRKREL